jgi:hypothetical protein
MSLLHSRRPGFDSPEYKELPSIFKGKVLKEFQMLLSTLPIE